jgi:hypothetical protein
MLNTNKNDRIAAKIGLNAIIALVINNGFKLLITYGGISFNDRYEGINWIGGLTLAVILGLVAAEY